VTKLCHFTSPAGIYIFIIFIQNVVYTFLPDEERVLDKPGEILVYGIQAVGP
jgi:hypothetical protein